MRKRMEGWQEATTWRELLGCLITDGQERERLAQVARVRPTTLQRWADGANRPHFENARLLSRAVPQETRALFLRLLLADFPELREEPRSDPPALQGIPGEFYARVLSNLALTPSPLCRQSTRDLILRQALIHLDPERQGLLVSLAVCVPPRIGKKVRSLCERDGVGTAPWPRDFSERLFFLGSESLVGYAVKMMRSFVINSRDEPTVLPAHWDGPERSAAAFPILRQARVAGGLLVASARDNFFTQERLALIDAYAHLASYIFNDDEFFDAEQIELMMMPDYNIQAPYFMGYARRVNQKLEEISTQGQPATLQRARDVVAQDLEDVLLQVYLNSESGQQVEQPN